MEQSTSSLITFLVSVEFPYTLFIIFSTFDNLENMICIRLTIKKRVEILY